MIGQPSQSPGQMMAGSPGGWSHAAGLMNQGGSANGGGGGGNGVSSDGGSSGVDQDGRGQGVSPRLQGMPSGAPDAHGMMGGHGGSDPGLVFSRQGPGPM